MNSGVAEIRVGILGTGYISKYHLEGLRTVPKARVAAVCDLSHGALIQRSDDREETVRPGR